MGKGVATGKIFEQQNLSNCLITATSPQKLLSGLYQEGGPSGIGPCGQLQVLTAWLPGDKSLGQPESQLPLLQNKANHPSFS